MNFTIEEAAYHRNGVGGEGFYTGVFTCDIDGTQHRMLLTFFPHKSEEGDICPAGKKEKKGKQEYANGRVAVLDLDILDLQTSGAVSFGTNSWRGDNFYEVADAIVREASPA